MSFSISIAESHLSWYCSSCYSRHHLSSCFSTLQQFLQRPRWVASLCSSWHLSYFTGVFLLAYHFKIGKQLLPRRLFSSNHSSPSKAFFRARYSFILWGFFEGSVNTNQIWKIVTLVRIRPKGAQYVIPRCSSVRPLASSCPLCNSRTDWRISKKLVTHVNHFEATCRVYGSDGLLQCQGHT